jgi:toxin HigB-1
MIQSYGDRGTEVLHRGARNARDRRLLARYPPEIVATARRKLDLIDSAQRLGDLRVPPGNRLEALHGDLTGYYSIRINDQWRIIFRWEGSDASEVTVVDYH